MVALILVYVWDSKRSFSDILRTPLLLKLPTPLLLKDAASKADMTELV